MIDQLVIPCSGRGSRFKAVTDTPKPLIPIAGRPMLDWALEGMKMPEPFKKAVVIFHADQEITTRQEEQVLSMVRRVAENVRLMIQTSERKGAADSVLLAADQISIRQSVAVWNCDQWIPEWNRKLPDGWDGWILTFRDPYKNPKWSYVEVDNEHPMLTGRVTKVVEKVPVSEWATVGGYFFKTGRDLLWAIEESILEDEKTNGEFYLAPVFNQLIKIGRDVAAVATVGMEGLGTPEDCDRFVLEHKLPDWKPKRAVEMLSTYAPHRIA